MCVIDSALAVIVHVYIFRHLYVALVNFHFCVKSISKIMLCRMTLIIIPFIENTLSPSNCLCSLGGHNIGPSWWFVLLLLTLLVKVMLS